MRVLIEPEIATGGQLVVAAGELRRVGRASPSDLVCADDDYLSGAHFAINCSDSGCQVRDLGSRNGTFLNGIRVQEADVHDGAQIIAGQTRFTVRIEHAALPGTSLPALDSADLDEPQQRVLETLQSHPEPLYALVDAARDERALDLLRSSGEHYQSLYEGQQGQELDNWAPYLVKLPKGSQLLLHLLHAGWGKSWGVFLACSQPFTEVRRHFRKFLLVRTESQQKLYFRFYDPRVLRSFLPACTAAQAASFWGPVQRFLLESERWELLQFSSDIAAENCSPAPSGVISENQFRAVERGLLFSRLYNFLLDRVQAPQLRRALDNRESVFGLWEQVFGALPAGSEYRLAIFLTYTLCHKCVGFEPSAAVRELLNDPDPEFRAKSYFEDTGVCRFSEFDL